MKNKLITLIWAFVFAMTCAFGLAACARDDVGDTGGTGDVEESIDGKYYGYGIYRQRDDGQEVGFVELKDGKCFISADSLASEHDFTVEGNYISASANPDSRDFDDGMAGIINNGVILTVCDGIYTIYCKEGKTPQDLYKNASGVGGKYLLYNDGFYYQNDTFAILGNAFVMYNRAGTVSRDGDALKCTVTFIYRKGFVAGTDFEAEYNFNTIGDNALKSIRVYTDIEDGEQQEIILYYCKIGYDADGKAITGEHLVTLDPNGGYLSLLAPLQTMTVKGKVYFGIPDDPDDIDAYKWRMRKYGYEFKGYNTKADGSSTQYYEGIEVENDTVFYAVWEEWHYEEG